jgi:predicted transposase/invertase (TIGR01784 family)
MSSFTQKDLGLLAITANEPPANNPWDKQIRFDVGCQFATGELADLEMTISPETDEPQRLEYYTARLFTSQNIRGGEGSYSKLKHTYQISVLVNKSLFQDNAFFHNFSYYDPKNSLSFDGKTHIITIELCKVARIAEDKTVAQMTSIERWTLFLRYHTDKEKRALVNEIHACQEDIAMAGETMLDFTKEQIEWFRNESRFKYQMDMQSRLVNAQDEARKQEKLETARKLKQMGLSVPQITEATGLSAGEIEQL